MLNISSTPIVKSVKRSLLKNSVSGRYDRAACLNNLLSIATVGKIVTFGSCGLSDVGILSSLGTLLLANFHKMRCLSKELKPIKERAIQIKKIKLHK